MNEHSLTNEDFDKLHAEIQNILEPAVKKSLSLFANLQAIPGRTSTTRFPLLSEITIEDRTRPEIDPVSIGVELRVDSGQFVIVANAIGEESGKSFLQIPDAQLPFETARDLLCVAIVDAAQRLGEQIESTVQAVFGRKSLTVGFPGAVSAVNRGYVDAR